MVAEMIRPVELSIIVPVLNECDQLPDFVANLATQRNLDAELLICDGGSTDGSCQWLEQQSNQGPFPLSVLQGPAGRARQLNQGIAAARGTWLLLLHVDSRLEDPRAISTALDMLKATGSTAVAGHFALRFRDMGEGCQAAYYFYSWKARLGRPETIHGDQGFLLHRALAEQVGCFDDTLPAMEDTDFAERLRRVGQWRLLPAEISTSARRFAVEGLWQRQLLGALLMCFRQLDWREFLTAAPQVYRQQKTAERLRLLPYFQLIQALLRQQSLASRWRLWYRSGWYVSEHAWQLFLALDARRCYRRGLPPGQGRTLWLDAGEPLFRLIFANPLGHLLVTFILRGWFAVQQWWLQRHEE